LSLPLGTGNDISV